MRRMQFIPRKIFWHPRAMVQMEGLGKLKISMITSGPKPATFQLAA
jgi:hypothetical protein